MTAGSYLEPNRNSMQKPKRGRYVLAFFEAISMLKNRRQNLNQHSAVIPQVGVLAAHQKTASIQ